MKKRVIITGITGLVGKALAKACLQAGYEVSGTARDPGRAKALLPPEVHLLPWNEVVNGRCQDELEDAFAVINLVGENIGSSRWTRKRRQQILESRIRAVEQLGAVISRLKSKPNRFLQASAVGFYGYELADPVDETGAQGSGFLAEVCTKLEAAAGSMHHTRLVVMRFGVVLDTREGALAKILMPVRRFRIGTFPVPAANILSWIHIEDLTGAILHILSKEDPSRVYNMSAPQYVAYRDLYSYVVKMQRILITLPVPFFLLKIPFGASMVRETLQASQSVIPARLKAEGFTFAFPGLGDALKQLLT
ncbi:MAG TPA: TIGR01777 family oxidoreductase [Bacteroidales bacterium]|nr:TIGR01777 family oxidoreductase [Bacteroidales bacterium]HRZ49383.1 TIGR01777 family oxidoreductase [Bacteroidales bacterium]